MTQTTSLASAGVSSAILMNPILKTTVIQLTVTSGSSGLNTVQVTLDDPSQQPAGSVAWAALSSVTASSAIDGIGATYTTLSPIGGLRIATTISSVGGTTVGSATLKALQSVSG